MAKKYFVACAIYAGKLFYNTGPGVVNDSKLFSSSLMLRINRLERLCLQEYFILILCLQVSPMTLSSCH